MAFYQDLVYLQEVIVKATKKELEWFGIDDDLTNKKVKINGFFETGYVEIKVDGKTYDIKPRCLEIIKE